MSHRKIVFCEVQRGVFLLGYRLCRLERQLFGDDYAQANGLALVSFDVELALRKTLTEHLHEVRVDLLSSSELLKTQVKLKLYFLQREF